MKRRKGINNQTPRESIQQSPLPQINKNYLVLPNRFLSVRHRRYSLFGTAGLENTGNICFINSALQCIFNAVPLTDYFLTGVYLDEINASNTLGTKGEVADAYAEVLEAQWMHVNESLLPKRLLQSMFKYAPQFGDGEQHDAHEFLAFLLDVLHEDLNRGDTLTPIPELSDSEDKVEPDEDRAAIAWKSYLLRNSSVIVDLFQGQLKSSVRCLRCNFVSTTFDTFMYLSLPIPKTTRTLSIVDCLMEFTKDETLPGTSWKCPKCKTHVQASKKIDIWKVPPLLIIHLKRFYYEKSSFGKLSSRIEFPVTGLDISSYVSGPQKELPLYNLFAKTDHDGDLASGHYSAYAKNRKNQYWYLMDDGVVRQVEEGEVVNEQSYLLFYCKVSITEYRRQSSKMPDLWPHLLSPKNSIDSEDNVPDPTASTASFPEQFKRAPKKSTLEAIPSARESPDT